MHFQDVGSNFSCSPDYTLRMRAGEVADLSKTRRIQTVSLTVTTR